MVNIKKKLIGKQIYYYLEHTFRHKGKIRKKEKYLGKKIPKNVEEVKKDFLSEIYREQWYPLFDRIKKNYYKELSTMPQTAKEKEIKIFSIKFTYED